MSAKGLRCQQLASGDGCGTIQTTLRLCDGKTHTHWAKGNQKSVRRTHSTDFAWLVEQKTVCLKVRLAAVRLVVCSIFDSRRKQVPCPMSLSQLDRTPWRLLDLTPLWQQGLFQVAGLVTNPDKLSQGDLLIYYKKKSSCYQNKATGPFYRRFTNCLELT